MFLYNRAQVNSIAKQYRFIANTAEKVLRLIDILNFIYSSTLRPYLVLKGGTAINLFLTNLPRLSVDIDMDFNQPISKEEMLVIRPSITKQITNYMLNEGYILSAKSKNTHALDSLVFSYHTTSESQDTLKIEINYSNRMHLFDAVDMTACCLGQTVSSIILDKRELIGSKINALISRSTPRDMYDISNLFQNGCITDIAIIRKIALFYLLLGNEIPFHLNSKLDECRNKISNVDYNKLRETLIPVLHKDEKIDVERFKACLIEQINNLFVCDDNDFAYLEAFNNLFYNPRLIFSDEIVERIVNHPMILWKMNSKKN